MRNLCSTASRVSKNVARKRSREPARSRSTVDSNGRTIWIADAHRHDGKRFIVPADEKSGLPRCALCKLNRPSQAKRPPHRPHRRRKLHRPHPQSRQLLRPKQNLLPRKRRLRGGRVPLQAQSPQGAPPRKRSTHPRRAVVLAWYGLTPRQAFTTGNARPFTAQRGRANR